MGGNIPGENFLGGGDFPGGVWWVGIFLGEIFLEPKKMYEIIWIKKIIKFKNQILIKFNRKQQFKCFIYFSGHEVRMLLLLVFCRRVQTESLIQLIMYSFRPIRLQMFSTLAIKTLIVLYECLCFFLWYWKISHWRCLFLFNSFLLNTLNWKFYIK